MKFISLAIENFLAITEAKIELADRGLVLIQGLNSDDTSADSNGAGKSSIADALCWALYGETARGVSGDDVVNHAVGKGTRVEVVIEDGGERYWITRHRKHKPHKNALLVQSVDGAGADIVLTKGTDKLTQDVVTKIVGASLGVFKAAVYAGQEQMPDLPAMTDKHLKILIEEAAGVTALEEAYREARTRLNVLAETHTKLETLLDQRNEQISWNTGQLATTIAQRDAWVTDNQVRIGSLTKEIGERIALVREMDRFIEELDEPAMRAGIAECDAKISAVTAENAELTRLHGVVAEARVTANTAATAVNQANAEGQRLAKEIGAVTHKIGCACGECGRDITEAEISAARDALVTRQTTAASAEKVARDRHDFAIKAYEAAVLAKNAYAASMTDLTQVNADRARFANTLAGIQRQRAERETAATRAKALGEQVQALRAQPNPHTANIQTLEEQIAALEKVVLQLTDDIAKSDAKKTVASVVAGVFSPAGVRAHILDEVTPFLNVQTAKYLSVLSDGNIAATWATLVPKKSGELTEKFSIEVVNDKGAKSFAGLSGGEKRKVRIATALALQDLVATRATKPIELFIGDEIDDALDEAGLERLTQILEEKASERGSVFVISHNSLSDWISNVMMIEKRAGKTVVTELT